MKTVPGFNVDVRRDGATVVVAPSGELDLATVGALRAALDGVERCEVLVLDLRGISFMESAGIAVLVGERRRAECEGFRLRVVSGPHQVQRLLEMTGAGAATGVHRAQWLARSRLEPFVRLGKTIRKHRDGILAATRLGINQGRPEALNNKVRLITRRAYGLRSTTRSAS